MRDPYEVLGVSRTASQDQIKAAYRSLAKKYHPDNFINSPLADSANKKMQEINEAYDLIVSGNASSDRYSGYERNSYNSYANRGSAGNDYSYIRSYISLNRLDEAEQLLENISPNLRDAEWYFLKGQVNYSRGWLDQAFTYFTTAHNMDPSNDEYESVYNSIKNQRSGGFRTTNTHRSSPDVCSICQGLLCADCCCECMGGDLIPCC